jgi:5'-methylthioadenosine phosphorylase
MTAAPPDPARPGLPADRRAPLAVIGGSGIYRFLDDVTDVVVDTPWGPPSAPVSIGKLGDRTIAFLPRHGTGHHLAPHRVPYRANLWALREVGARRVYAPCASGSLQPHLAPGEFVVCDQLVDRTSGRADTYFDGDIVNHVSFAEPYCPELRRAVVEAGAEAETTVHDGGTVVVIQGPRFSTRAESQWFRGNGWDVVNMTQYPEALLARELGLCYASIALITDWDAGVEGDPSLPTVTQTDVFAVMEANAHHVRNLLFAALDRVGLEPGCGCAAATNGVVVTAPGS